jgi:hypothetical protein
VKLLFTFYGALDFMQKANLMIAGSLGFLVLGLGLVGCSNPKDASKENFAKAISQMLAKEPYEIPQYSSQHFGNDRQCALSISMGVAKLEDKTLSALLQAGFLSSSPVKADDPKYGIYANNPKWKVYQLTDKGKQVTVLQGQGHDGGQWYKIPFCKVSLKEVLSYTEPSDAMGMKASQVKYSYVLGDFPDWVKDENLLKVLDRTVKMKVESAGKPITTDRSVVLTNEGWAAS